MKSKGLVSFLFNEPYWSFIVRLRFGIVTPIIEWYAIVRTTLKEEFKDFLPPEVPGGGKSYIIELAVSMVLGGKDIADLRGAPGYKGEWGSPYTVKHVFGDKLRTLNFNNFDFKGTQ